MPAKIFSRHLLEKYHGGTSALERSYVPVDGVALLEMSRALFRRFEQIFRRVGVDKDLSDNERHMLAQAVIDYAEANRLQKGEPLNLNLSIVLARNFGSGTISPDDDRGALAFVRDRLVDDERPLLERRYKVVRLSEILPIIQNLEKRDDIKSPYKRLRSTQLERGQSFWSDADARKHSAVVAEFISDQKHKYGLMNRYPSALDKIELLLGMYASKELERLDGEQAIRFLLESGADDRWRIVDDRGGE